MYIYIYREREIDIDIDMCIILKLPGPDQDAWRHRTRQHVTLRRVLLDQRSAHRRTILLLLLL